jgi:hypothetical protein
MVDYKELIEKGLCLVQKFLDAEIADDIFFIVNTIFTNIVRENVRLGFDKDVTLEHIEQYTSTPYYKHLVKDIKDYFGANENARDEIDFDEVDRVIQDSLDKLAASEDGEEKVRLAKENMKAWVKNEKLFFEMEEKKLATIREKIPFLYTYVKEYEKAHKKLPTNDDIDKVIRDEFGYPKDHFASFEEYARVFDLYGSEYRKAGNPDVTDPYEYFYREYKHIELQFYFPFYTCDDYDTQTAELILNYTAHLRGWFYRYADDELTIWLYGYARTYGDPIPY